MTDPQETSDQTNLSEAEIKENEKLLHEYFGYPALEGCPDCQANVYHGKKVSKKYIGTPVPPNSKGIPISASRP